MGRPAAWKPPIVPRPPARRRPFYTEYAWAYDILIDRPVRKECAAIVGWFIDRHILPGAEILDAGCGTGRYAIELARRGYRVHGIDLAPDLLEVARQRPILPSHVSFEPGDMLDLPHHQYDGVLCRGVLNDLLDDPSREQAFSMFGHALRPGGVLILDVREWTGSVERKEREPLFRKRVSTEHGELTFSSQTTLDEHARRLLIAERHELLCDDVRHVAEFSFAMRCWEQEELRALLARHGFDDVQSFGAYDPQIGIGTTDRLVIVSSRGDPPGARP